MPGDEPVLICDRLSIAYGPASKQSVNVVDSVSFRLNPGDALGVVGESGSGKSTLARALLGYGRAGARFVSGRLLHQGIDLTQADTKQLSALRGKVIAMIPQNPLSSLTYHLRVGEQVIEILRTRSGLTQANARPRMLSLLEQTGLRDVDALARRFPHQLSGGQRQRVVIACALACEPAVLVLDEPTTALDKTTEGQVLDLVTDLRRLHRLAIVLVSHDLNVVARVCDQVLVMKDGRVVEQGTVNEVFTQPKSDYAKQLIGSVLRIEPGEQAAGVTSNDSVLALNGIGFSYGAGGWFVGNRSAPRTLESVSLNIGRGEVLGVIGESGSGKTTLGMIVAGMVAPAEGLMRFEGAALAASVKARSNRQRQRIQMVFQDPLSSLNPRQTVGAALARPMTQFYGLNARATNEQARELLRPLGMDASFLDRYPRQLSGGQQQRVAIARAFAARPSLLICDEITSALDASIQSQLLEQLLQMQRAEGVALMLITHDLSVVWKLAPRVVVIQAGRIIDEGPTAQILGNPRNEYTAGLVEAATRVGRMGGSNR